MADNAILFKYLAKSIGMKHGVIPSFMAKPWGNVSPIELTLNAHRLINDKACGLQRVCPFVH